jgi:hypothetical protein
MTGENDARQKTRKDGPVPIDINLGKSALTIKQTCGQCIHLKRMAYPAFKKPCIELGIIEESKPCEKFAANPALIKFSDSEHTRNIAKAMRELNDRELKLLAVVINQETRTRKRGFEFGQIVYFRVFGGDYISNYVKAKVVSADRDYVHVQGADGCLATLYHKSVLTGKEWKKKEFYLLKINKIKDPNRAKYLKAPTKAEREVNKIMNKALPPDLTSDIRNKSVILAGGQPRKSSGITPLDRLLIVRNG